MSYNLCKINIYLPASGTAHWKFPACDLGCNKLYGGVSLFTSYTTHDGHNWMGNLFSWMWIGMFLEWLRPPIKLIPSAGLVMSRNEEKNKSVAKELLGVPDSSMCISSMEHTVTTTWGWTVLQDFEGNIIWITCDKLFWVQSFQWPERACRRFVITLLPT